MSRPFSHLHCHTQWSLLDGQSRPEDMAAKAADSGQAAVAITDHGNMFGLYHFASACGREGVKPILGCELYLVADRHKQKFSRKEGERDVRYHQLALAMTHEGYRNLSRLCSIGYLEGKYSGYPRVDKDAIARHSAGVAFTTCCIGGEVPQAIIRGDLAEARRLVKWWVDLVGRERYFVELQRHKGLEDIDGLGVSQEDVTQELIKIAREMDLRTFCSNDSHYTERKDAGPHDALLCLGTGQKVNQAERKFKFSSADYYFKSTREMGELFADVPNALETAAAIADEAWEPNLLRDVIMPEFTPPDGEPQDQMAYLRSLARRGAARRYGSRCEADDVRERVAYELEVVERMGFPGYFLIVADVIAAARAMGVKVGPGRGSAAGSLVAYCLGITDVCPLEHGLLFERFINPDRISLPDIDIDFDDDSRHKVVEYVLKKYGERRVARIATFSRLGAKAALRDMGRVLQVSIPEVNRVVGLYPERSGLSLRDLLDPERAVDDFEPEDRAGAAALRKLAAGRGPIAKMVNTAREVEGNVRGTSLHACGYIIAPTDVSSVVPVATAKDEALQVTQVSNDHVEAAGLLKVDFLGLRTLSTLAECERLVHEYTGERIDAENPPAEDPATLALFASGHTVGIFQFESDGMRRYLRELKPDRFADVVAMNALYRPGPMQYIPNYIARKHGREPVTYDLPVMEEVLAETYGVTVYQESVMRLSQAIASFTGGQADTLRKGIGKKKADVIAQMKPAFVAGGVANGHPEQVLLKIWRDWEEYAEYAFNKSHSVAYATIAYRAAYLKAHYPAAFMAAYLVTVQGKPAQTLEGLRECRRMGIPVVVPCVQKSRVSLATDGERIYFGLGNVRGVGKAAERIVTLRPEGGWATLEAFVRDTVGGPVTAATYEGLAKAGALDSFGFRRCELIAQVTEKERYFKLLCKKLSAERAKQARRDRAGKDERVRDKMPAPPVELEPGPLHDLLLEYESLGMFVSGHPLDSVDHQLALAAFTLASDAEEKIGMRVALAGYVLAVERRVSKKGNPWAVVKLSDQSRAYELRMFGRHIEAWQRDGLFEVGAMVAVTGVIAYDQMGQGWSLKLDGHHDAHTLHTVSHAQLCCDVEAVYDEAHPVIERLAAAPDGHRWVYLRTLNEDGTKRVRKLPRRIDVTDELLRWLHGREDCRYHVGRRPKGLFE